MDFDPSSLIFYLFVIVSAAASWLQKRREKKAKAEEGSWRDNVDAHPLVPPPTPPVSKTETEEKEASAFDLEREFKRLVGEVTGQPVPPLAKPAPEPPPVPRPVLDPAVAERAALAKARMEAERVLKQVRRKVPARRPRPSGEFKKNTSLTRQLRSRSSARQAMLASFILGPPKALE